MNEFIIYFMLVSLATQAALQDTICKSTGLLAVDCFDMKRIALFFYVLLWQGRGNLTLLITAVWLLVPPAAKPCRGTRMG